MITYITASHDNTTYIVTSVIHTTPMPPSSLFTSDLTRC